MNVRKSIRPTQVYPGLVALVLSTSVARGDITSNLEVRYRLDASSAADSSGNGNTGTLNNDATFTANGRFGGGVELAGTDEYIGCPAIAATDEATELTIAFWVYVDTLEDFTQFCGKLQNANNLFVVQSSETNFNGNDDLQVAIHKSGTNGYVETTGDVISEDKWLHVTVVYDNSQSGDTNKVKIYINGQLVDREAGTALPTSLHDGSEPWRIGYRADDPGSFGLHGKVDEFYMYSRALTASDVLELYNWTSVGIFSCDFNALTSKIENNSANVLDASDEVTICAWVYPEGQGEDFFGVGGMAVALGGNFLLYHATDGENLTLRTDYQTSDSVSTFAVPHNAWTPVAIAHKYIEDSTPTIRVNFQSVSPTQTGPEGDPAALTNGFSVGNVPNQSLTWDGRIAHVQVFNRVLSAAEMDAALKAPGSVKGGLRLWLPMSHETDVDDRSGNGFDGTPTDVTTATNGPVYDSLFQFGTIDETLGQIVIRPNGSEPAIGVKGLGTRSKITASRSLNTGARFITTEDWGSNSTVIEPTVMGVYLDGDQGIPDTPYGNSTELALGDNPVCHAIAIDGDAAEVTGCKVFDFRGDGIRVNNSTAEFSRMIRMPRVRDNKVSHGWTGIHLGAVDSQCSGNRVANVRDVGILDTAGAAQLQNNHVYGATTAIQFGVQPSSGGPSTSVGDRFADAPYGFVINQVASRSAIMDGTCFGCWIRGIVSKGAQCLIANTRVEVPATSIQHPGELLATYTYTTGTLSSSGTTVTLSGGEWPYWVTGATIVSDNQTRTIATLDSPTQVTVTVAPSPAWSDDTHNTTLYTYSAGMLSSSSTTVTLSEGIWPAWVAGATIVSDNQSRTIVTRNSDTQVIVSVAPSPAWSDDEHSTTLTKIVGIDLHWEGANNYVKDCMVRMSDAADPFPADTGKTGSVGIYVQQHGARIEGVRLQGGNQSNEVGVRVAASRNRVYIDVDTMGQEFDHAGDSVVTFEDPLSTGLVYITYLPNETPLTIPANWGAGGSLKIFKRLGEAGAWTEVSQGVAQP